jgi:hypothetical protein
MAGPATARTFSGIAPDIQDTVTSGPCASNAAGATGRAGAGGEEESPLTPLDETILTMETAGTVLAQGRRNA